ncbi:MAG: hypothetical protein R3C12_21420 [Planctomycetaceae bacterium]
MKVTARHIAATGFVTHPQQKRENSALRICDPFPEFRATTNAPGTDVFLSIDVDGFEVLTHKKERKEATRRRPSAADLSTTSPSTNCP